MLAADTSLSVVLVRRLNMFPVVACIFNAFVEYTREFVKSQAKNCFTRTGNSGTTNEGSNCSSLNTPND